MSIRYLDLSGAVNFWTNIKNFILSKIPTKTSELTNDSGFLTQHQSLSNYVTLNSEQTITGKKLFTNSTTKVNSVNTFIGSTLFIDTSASVPRGSFPETAYRVGRIYIGDGTSYNGSWFIIDPIIDTNKAVYRMVTTNPDNTDSTRFSIVWDSTKEGVRRRKNVSTGDLLPIANNTYNLGADDQKWDIGYIHNLIGSNKENLTEDANDYYSTTSGSHMTFYTTTNDGTKLSNVPAAVNTHLESRTIRYLSSSDWIVEQICHNSTGLYYRKGTNGTWEDWKTFAFTNSNITGKASNVTGTVAIANGGTGATTRLNAVKALTNEAVASPTHFLAITTNYAKAGYTTVAQAKTVLGITGDIVSHNASEFLTSHQSLSSCVKNVVTNNQTIKSTGITRGTAPSSAQTFGIAFSDNNNKYIGNIYGQYATDKSTYVGLYAYKGSTTANSDNVSIRVGYDASGNAYTYAPTPATTDNSTQIATTAFVKAQDSGVVHKSGDETVGGKKTFSDNTYITSLNFTSEVASSSSSSSAVMPIVTTVTYTDSSPSQSARLNLRITADGVKSFFPHDNNVSLGLATRVWSDFFAYHGYFRGQQQGDEYSGNARTNLTLLANRDVSGQSGCVVDTFRENTTQGTGSHILGFGIKENSVRYEGCRLSWFYDDNNSGYVFSLRPTTQGTNQPIKYELGTSSAKWSTINGLNPSSLGMPDLSNGIDISSYIPALVDGNTQGSYTPSVNGFIAFRGIGNGCSIVQGNIGNNVSYVTDPTSTRFVNNFLPVVKDVPVVITARGLTTIELIYFYPCQGNV